MYRKWEKSIIIEEEYQVFSRNRQVNAQNEACEKFSKWKWGSCYIIPLGEGGNCSLGLGEFLEAKSAGAV